MACFLLVMKQNGIRTIEEKKNGKVTAENIREAIGVSTVNELQFLCKLFEAPESSGFASSQSEGRLAASLHQKGIIEPRGRVGNHVRWAPLDGLFHREERDLVKSIANWKEQI